MDEPYWLLHIGFTVAFLGGIIGAIYYKKVHKMFTGTAFEDSPPEFLLLPLWGMTALGAGYLLTEIVLA